MLLVTAGSRGDVEPFVALAHRAMRAGHEVRLALPDNSGARVDDLDTVSLGADFSRLIQSQGVSGREAMRSFSTVVKPTMRAVIVTTVTAALEYEPEVIVAHPKILSAPIAADLLGIPHIMAEIVPVVTPTRAFPAPGTVGVNLGPLNRLTFAAVGLSSRMFAAELDEARTLAGLPRGRRSRRAASLVPVSPHLLPRPDDWPSDVHITGAWTEATGASGASGARGAGTADERVERFIDGGPFVYAGFGSMVLGDPAERSRAIVEAARARGLRVLLATGLGGLSGGGLAGDDVLPVQSVDHTTVLPRAVAAIHHGGAGTVHAVARAGVPSIVVPFFADQPFWGAQLHRIGVAPAPIPVGRLTAARVGAALDAVDRYAAAATDIGLRMRDDDGATTALDLIERYVPVRG
jgi:sterol 3beta-glucosyltransferase